MEKKVGKVALFVVALLVSAAAFSGDDHWEAITRQAKQQTVYFYAWGGHAQVNQYLRWAGDEIKRLYDVDLVHVKVADISEAVSLVLADKSAGRTGQGRVDLLWLNGENFAGLKQAELLHGPFTEQLPNYRKVDQRLPVNTDFSIPVEGLEAPWGVGQLVMMFDQWITPTPPDSAQALLDYARANPGRVSYPQPPQFHGVAFLKQLLLELTANPELLQQPADQIDFAGITQPLWDYLDQLHKVAWYQGRRFPQSDRHMMQLLDNRELHLAISFNPLEAAAAVRRGELVDSVRSYGFANGTLTNIHFLAIPRNSSARAGAKVVIDFLLSPQAQQRKANSGIWGDPSVLASRWSGSSAESAGENGGLLPSIKEPHFSWQGALAEAWLQRYGYQ